MDFRNDNNPKNYNHILNEITLPSFVKTASDTTQEETCYAFADIYRRELPIDTKDNTFKSYVYFKTAGYRNKVSPEHYESIENALSLAVTAHDIEDEIADVDASIHEVMKKQASTDDKPELVKFALSVEYRDKGMQNFLPIDTKANTLKSIGELKDNTTLPIEWFHDASLGVVKAAKHFGIDEREIPARILNHGVEREPNFKYASIVANQRKSVVRDVESHEIYDDIVKVASMAESQEELDEMVQMMVDLDRVNRVKYDHVNVDPYVAFYSGPKKDDIEKMASEYIIVHDALIPVEYVKLAKQNLEDVFTTSFATKVASVIEQYGDNNAKLSDELTKLMNKRQVKEFINLVD